MKAKDIDGLDLKITDLDGFFNVYEDSNRNYRYNINSTLYLDVPESRLQKAKMDHSLFWTTISYKLYNTTRLWWLLMKLNNVKPDDILKPVPSGEEVKYMTAQDIKQYVVPILMDSEA